MGNVHASEMGGGPPPGPGMPPPPTEDTNPGTVEEIHKECKEVFPMPFEGGKLMVSKMLSNNFQVRSPVNVMLLFILHTFININ